MPEYVFRGGGNREICFSAASDQAAWTYAIENHACSRARAMHGEVLYRVDRIPVERPDHAKIDQHNRILAASHNITTNRR